MKPTVDNLISMLNLQPLPDEGGFFRQTWALAASGNRPAGTAILYLVTPMSFSALHRLDADEIFHFYMGDACEQFIISPEADCGTITLGHDLLSGQQVQSVVPAGYWQGTRLVAGGDWSLIGTTMVPGYHQAGFELASMEILHDLPVHCTSLATS